LKLHKPPYHLVHRHNRHHHLHYHAIVVAVSGELIFCGLSAMFCTPLQNHRHATAIRAPSVQGSHCSHENYQTFINFQGLYVGIRIHHLMKSGDNNVRMRRKCSERNFLKNHQFGPYNCKYA